MGTRSSPVGLLQPQGSWNAGATLNPHFGNLNYLLRPEPAVPAPDRVYTTNQDLWQSIIEERLRIVCHFYTEAESVLSQGHRLAERRVRRRRVSRPDHH